MDNFINFDVDIQGMLKQVMPNIHTNPNIPQEIKDAWIGLATETNIKHLHEGDYEEDLY